MHIQPSYPQHTNQTPSPAVQEWYQTRSQKGLYALFKIRLGLWLQEAHLTATYRNINFREAGPTGCPCFYFAVFSLSPFLAPSPLALLSLCSSLSSSLVSLFLLFSALCLWSLLWGANPVLPAAREGKLVDRTSLNPCWIGIGERSKRQTPKVAIIHFAFL